MITTNYSSFDITSEYKHSLRISIYEIFGCFGTSYLGINIMDAWSTCYIYKLWPQILKTQIYILHINIDARICTQNMLARRFSVENTSHGRTFLKWNGLACWVSKEVPIGRLTNYIYIYKAKAPISCSYIWSR